MKVHFITPTLLSYLDLFSMGGSDKADNESSIGKYNSGLCYSMALALRNNIDMSVKVHYQEPFNDFEDRNCETLYTISTYNKVCEETDKEKELIQITKSVSKQSFFSVNCTDYGGGDFDPEIIPTGYSVKLGIDWSLYMLLREIYSNMLDEGGCYYENDYPEVRYGTVFTLEFEEDSEFSQIWKNRHLYINEQEPLFKVSDSIEVLKNDEGYLRIYKQNILVYEDKNIPSRFAWNIKFGEIDERRILNNVYSVEQSIAYAIQNCKNKEFLREIITADFKGLEKEFLSSDVSYSSYVSDEVKEVAYEVYDQHGDVKSYDWLMDRIKKQKDCKIAGKKIKTIEDHLWGYSTVVTVETTPTSFAEPSIIVDDIKYITPFASDIKKHYNFDLDVEVKIAKLKGRKVVADKYEQCLIIDKDFNIEEDFPNFIVEYIDLTQKGNVIDNLAKYICNLIKK